LKDFSFLLIERLEEGKEEERENEEMRMQEKRQEEEEGEEKRNLLLEDFNPNLNPSPNRNVSIDDVSVKDFIPSLALLESNNRKNSIPNPNPDSNPNSYFNPNSNTNGNDYLNNNKENKVSGDIISQTRRLPALLLRGIEGTLTLTLTLSLTLPCC
jgi:hypothetical protein